MAKQWTHLSQIITWFERLPAGSGIWQLLQDVKWSQRQGSPATSSSLRDVFLMCKHEISPFQVIISTQELGNIPGWWFQPLWKIWKSVGMIIPNIWKIIKFHGSKAPTRYRFQPPHCHHFWQHLHRQATGATGGRLTTSPTQGGEFPHPNVPMLGLRGKQGFVSQGTMGYNGYYCILMHTVSYDHCDL